MRVSRITISNFRNFSSLDVNLGNNAVIVGENKIGKSNFLFALRLILDPSLPDSSRRLREEDFWDGVKRPLTMTDRITISIEISEFEDNEFQLAILSEYLIKTEPMVASLTYVWQPIPTLKGNPKKDSDYEYIIFGGGRPENKMTSEVRRGLPLELIHALRDCESDLLRWGRSPLRPLLDKVASEIDKEDLKSLAAGIDEATEKISNVDAIQDVSKSIEMKLTEMVGKSQTLDTSLRYSSTDPDKLIRALRVFIDNGKRDIAEASLGSANVLYFALKMLEYDQLVKDGNREHTFLAIEEPEAHLHPNLQRLIFRNYLASRQDLKKGAVLPSSTILITTHSPHIASVTPLIDFVILKKRGQGKGTGGVSTAGIKLSRRDSEDLERYLDVNRGEVLFSKGIIFVEGDAERYIVPAIAKNNGFDLDEIGITVCSISGTNFYPYLKFFGPSGLDFPISALTDLDPDESAGTPAKSPIGHDRIVNQMMQAIISDEDWKALDFDEVLSKSPDFGIFVNSHTLEIDLYLSGLHMECFEAISSVTDNGKMISRFKAWAEKTQPFNATAFIKDIDSVGKGRFAQRLASIILKSGTKACPNYILNGIKYVSEKCK